MKRRDGRLFDQLRSITLERHYSKYAEGSCFVNFGDTKVLCTASVDKNVPLFLRNKGIGWVSSEYGMLPRSVQNRIGRDKGNSGRSVEIQRLVGRCLRSVVNMNQLGERTIWVDCDVIQGDGGTRVASILGGFIALVDCLNRLYQERVIPQMLITDYLAGVSVGLWKGNCILDLCYEEDSDAEVDFNVVMKGSKEFVEVQGCAEKGTFSRDELNRFLDLAQKGIEEIIALERAQVGDILKI